jgi:two-component system phosphate regulon sensor histidine kinase PhoR
MWSFFAALLAVALVVGLVFMPAWGWGMLAIAPLYFFVHRGELGPRVAGDGRWAGLKLPWKARPAGPAAAARGAESGVAVVDRQLHVVWCNDRSALHLGMHPGCLATAVLADLAPECGPMLPVAREERMLLRTVDGRCIAVQWVPFVDADWLLLSRDVTGKEESDAGRRDVLADASHELRTPLTVMMGLLETVTELDLERERSAYYFNLMEQQGRRMQDIVEGLLKLSKLESLPAPHCRDRVDMGRMLARICAEAEFLSRGRHAIVMDADIGVDLLGAESEIASAVGNLVSNAVRYTPAGGEIRVAWRPTEDGAALSVQDTGIGIEPQHIPLLTRRFYRVEDGRSRDVGGTGLGLSIVRLVLERHEATLEIRSAPGKGSVFAARFPAQRVLRSNAAQPHVKAFEAS